MIPLPLVPIHTPLLPSLAIEVTVVPGAKRSHWPSRSRAMPSLPPTQACSPSLPAMMPATRSPTGGLG
jgi:hypothetical protein